MPISLPTTAARTLIAAALSLALAPVAACADPPSAEPASTQTAATYDATTPAADETDGTGAGMEVLDAWTVARPDVSRMAMTGVFGIVRNISNHDILVASATTTASERTELHTTVSENGQEVMKAVDTITVPAGGSLVLQPGGDHVMALDLKKPIAVGDTVTVTLTTQDGQRMTFDAVAKQFAGANEPYHSSGPGRSGRSLPTPTS